MSSKREKLEARAEELGLSFVPDTTNDDLQELINDFQNTDDESTDDDEATEEDFKDEREFTPDTLFYRSTVSGLSIQYGETPERDQQPTEVKFDSHEVFDEVKGNHYKVGYLATDESDVQEILADDLNVEEITEEEYRRATNPVDPKVKRSN